MTIKQYVALRKEEIKTTVFNMDRKPNLKIIQLNDDGASNAYVKGKLKDCLELGIKHSLIKLDPSTSQEQLLKLIDELNNDNETDGFIVQMPLGNHIDEELIKVSINPKKDVDGFNPLSEYAPCTPKGIMNYLRAIGYNLEGKNALVIGRSNIVGKPLAHLLLKANANVTVVHSKTSKEDMARYIKNSDIICIAIGKMHYLDESYEYKKDAVIIDVGINRQTDGLHGDAKPNLDVYLQTPVPGGVGLLTRLALIENLLLIKEKNDGI